jgi:hypothetical protein
VTPEPIHLLSLGAGVQSSTLALMAAAGEVTPMPLAAIFADTMAEPSSVYLWLDWLEKQLPFPVYRVTAGSLTEATLSIKHNRKTGRPYYNSSPPIFILNANGAGGQLGRHCTRDYKIIPIQRLARRLGNIKRGQKTIGVIQWIGISLDEMQRMKPSRNVWYQHRWPLVEKRMTRLLCLDWMRERGYSEPPRSACVYCPYHRDSEWRRLQTEEPEAFAEAVRVEKALQDLHRSISANGKINGTPFLHRDRIPLDQIDFTSDRECGQLPLWDDECEGMCGV